MAPRTIADVVALLKPAKGGGTVLVYGSAHGSARARALLQLSDTRV